MNHIIVNIVPFVDKQDIYVYVAGCCKEQVKVPQSEIVNTVKSLQNKYNIEVIDLCGLQDYVQHFKTQMLNKFTNIKEINIINK